MNAKTWLFFKANSIFCIQVNNHIKFPVRGQKNKLLKRFGNALAPDFFSGLLKPFGYLHITANYKKKPR
jgi:hypothetical protein